MSKLRFCLLGLAWFLGGCQDKLPVSQAIDRRVFEHFGSTLFSDPDLMTTKELHFDTGRHLGREVVVEGSVLDLGEHGTHIVVKDDFGRLLVVTTDIGGVSNDMLIKENQPLRVLGVVERGKKGLPYIYARAIKPFSRPVSRERE